MAAHDLRRGRDRAAHGGGRALAALLPVAEGLAGARWATRPSRCGRCPCCWPCARWSSSIELVREAGGGGGGAAVAALLLALHPLQVQQGRNARMYALGVLLAALTAPAAPARAAGLPPGTAGSPTARRRRSSSTRTTTRCSRWRRKALGALALARGQSRARSSAGWRVAAGVALLAARALAAVASGPGASRPGGVLDPARDRRDAGLGRAALGHRAAGRRAGVAGARWPGPRWRSGACAARAAPRSSSWPRPWCRGCSRWPFRRWAAGRCSWSASRCSRRWRSARCSAWPGRPCRDWAVSPPRRWWARPLLAGLVGFLRALPDAPSATLQVARTPAPAAAAGRRGGGGLAARAEQAAVLRPAGRPHGACRCATLPGVAGGGHYTHHASLQPGERVESVEQARAGRRGSGAPASGRIPVPPAPRGLDDGLRARVRGGRGVALPARPV